MRCATAARMSPSVVGNSMAYPQTLKKKIPVARVVSANQVSGVTNAVPRTIEALDEAQGIQMLKLIP